MSTATGSYQGHRYPLEIINHSVWLYFRFSLSFREVEELMLARGDKGARASLTDRSSQPRGCPTKRPQGWNAVVELRNQSGSLVCNLAISERTSGPC